MTWKLSILTLFPEMFPGPLAHSLIGKALEKRLWELETVNIRDFATDNHKTVDDTPFGGGAGMVIKPDVLGEAIESINYDKIIYLSPRGKIFNQAKSKELLSYHNLTIICGRYEGIDQRIIDYYDVEEISIGDFILSGGEIACFSLIDSCVRQIDGVLSNPETLKEESFGKGDFEFLLEYPLYTRPHTWKNKKVPDVLCSGNHTEINQWRLDKSKEITQERRVDLWEKHLSVDKNEAHNKNKG